MDRRVLSFAISQRIDQTEEKHDKNLLRLIGTKPSDKSSSNLKKRWVKNLSSKELSELERKGLEHGLEFAVVPNRIPTAERRNFSIRQ
jgi:GTPase SAR1 family protein